MLPEDEAEQRGAWQLVRALDLPIDRVLPLALAGPLVHVPDAFAGVARVLGPEELDWRRLPAPAAAAGAWGWRPDVALDLSRPFRLPAAFLAGGSPAAFRVGLYDPRAEPFFDLLFAPSEAGEGVAAGLRRYLAALDPPVLPVRGEG